LGWQSWPLGAVVDARRPTINDPRLVPRLIQCNCVKNREPTRKESCPAQTGPVE
jgi:hypothetical protein